MKKILSLVLAMLMILSTFPLSTLAEEWKDGETEWLEEAPEFPEENEAAFEEGEFVPETEPETSEESLEELETLEEISENTQILTDYSENEDFTKENKEISDIIAESKAENSEESPEDKPEIITEIQPKLMAAPMLASGTNSSYGVNLSGDEYQTNINPFTRKEGLKGQCTWYVWGRVYEKLGISIKCFIGDDIYGSFGNAIKWYENAPKKGIYSVGQDPKANSIMVASNGVYGGEVVGHVMFVEKIENGYAYITESNYKGLEVYSEDIINLSTGNRSSNNDHVNITGYIYFDTEPPKITDYAYISHVSQAGFWVNFAATDDTGVSEAYLKVWRDGESKNNAVKIPAVFDGDNNYYAAVSILNYFDNIPGGFHVKCFAKDQYNEPTELDISQDVISVFEVYAACGTYRTLKDTARCHYPAATILGKSTQYDTISKGSKVSITGFCINDDNEVWAQTAGSKWVRAEDLLFFMKDCDIASKFSNIGTDEPLYWVGNQIVKAIQPKTLKSGGAALLATSNSVSVRAPSTPYAKIYGTVIQHYSQSGVAPKAYAVSLNANGGEVSSDSKTVYSGGTYGVLPTPYRMGYRFDGWFTAAEAGNEVTANTAYPFDADSTIYAHWTRIILLDNVKCGDDLFVTLYGDGEMILMGSGAMTSHPWTDSAYKNKVVSVHFPAEMTALCTYAFDGCTYLQEMNLPDITSIPEFAFRSCQYLNQINLPESVTSIGNYAFANSGLQSLTLPSYLRSLGGYILYGNTGVKSINIPATLSSVSYSSSRYYYSDNYGNNDGYQYGPFTGSRIEMASVTEGIKTIPAGLFTHANYLKSVILPETVEVIGSLAFYGTDALQSLHLPDSVTVINEGALAYSGFKSLTGAKGLKTIANYSFFYSGLEKFLIEANLESFGSSVFTGCKSLCEVEINSIPDSTFKGCTSLQKVTVGDSAKSIGNYAFQDCTSLKSVTIGKNVTTLGNYVFSGCTSLSDIVWSEKLSKIGIYSFYNCDSLAELNITFPLEAIPDYAFYDCDALKTVTMSDTVKTLGNNAFYNCDALSEIHFSSVLESIGSYAFYNSDSLVTVEMPSTVATLGQCAFYDCDALKSVTLGTALKEIAASTFCHCDSLESIVIPYCVTSIGANAFYNDVSLTSVSIPKSVTSIGTGAFSYQDKLTISGLSGTYAETWAKENGFPFNDLNVHANSVRLNVSEITIIKGKSYKLSLTIEPENFTDDVSWKSSQPSVATIDADGTVKALSIGTATIKVVVGGKSTDCVVTVVQPVTSIGLNKTSLSMNALDTFQLTATVSPSGAADKTVEWYSSDSNIATVDENGLVTAYGKGTATITVKAKDESGVWNSCRVTVSNTVHIVRSVEEFESEHNYLNNCTDLWLYRDPNAEKLFVSFDAQTNMEKGFDYLTIMDGTKNVIGKYSGTELAGKMIAILGDTVIIQITSDGSGNEWGFKVSSIKTEESAAKLGDINSDGVINVIDANIVRRSSAKLLTLDDKQKLAADVNNDGFVNVIDANLIRRYAAKLITEFPEAN